MLIKLLFILRSLQNVFLNLHVGYFHIFSYLLGLYLWFLLLLFIIYFRNIDQNNISFIQNSYNKSMHNQRLLYSETKKPRVGSINKENNIRLFNDSFIN